MAKCRSCDAEITWAWTTGGKKMPVDTEPNPNRGNLVLLRSHDPDGPLVLALSDLTQEARIAAARHEVLYVSHFATCPEAATWRER